MKQTEQTKQLIKEILTGLVFWSAVILLVLVIAAKHKMAVAAGVGVGMVTAAGLLFHMVHHLDIALDLDSGRAQRHTQFAAMQRTAIMAVVMVVSVFLYRYIHPIGVVLGIFGLKIAALLQPRIHRMFGK